jgi:nucleotide-binding universal stress UspA family protein
VGSGPKEAVVPQQTIHERLQDMIRSEVAALAYLEVHEAVQEQPLREEPAARPVTVVVGVDGSPASDDAVAWAAVEAVARGGRLVLVRVEEPHAAVPPTTEHERRASDELAALSSSVKQSHRLLGDVGSELLHGVAGPALVARARKADLLVVGSRGRGPVSRSLLGSVSTYCVTHASCPTTVVPRGWSAFA